MRAQHIAIALSLSVCPAFAQTPEPPPSFEVASVKPAAPPNRNGGRGSAGGRGGSPGQVMFTNSSMSQLLTYAYAVKRYQISGPSTLDTDRYDIVAKLPQGARREDSPAMLQTLLKERFGLAVHRETKELPMYSLVVAKNGPKLKETVESPLPKDGADAAPPMLPPGERKMGADGFPIMPGGGRGGSLQMQMRPGRMRMKVTKETMEQLADMLTNQLDRRVTDQTGLTKSYDFILEFAPESGGGGNPFGMAMPMATPPADAGAAPEPDAAPGIMAALQDQLGLRLEPKKGPVDLLVVDHVEKTPTEN